jgi:hypothetical protein
MRLRCRAHNQYAAECVYGSAFMRGKRERARERAAHARERARARETARAQAREVARAHESAHARDAAQTHAAAQVQERATGQARATAAAAQQACEEVIPWLRALGFRADEARAAAARCAAIPDAPLEERVRWALSSLAPNRARRTAPAERSPA